MKTAVLSLVLLLPIGVAWIPGAPAAGFVPSALMLPDRLRVAVAWQGPEYLPRRHEQVRLGGQVGTTRLDQVDDRQAIDPPDLERLLRDAGFGHGYERNLYAQAWALVYYLRVQHPQQFLTFLDLARSPGAARPLPA